jgi:hypothetical protein
VSDGSRHHGSIARRLALRSTTLTIAVDTVCVLVFVAVGRGNHDEDPGVGGTLRTAAPFLIALVIAWVVAPRRRDLPTALRTGLRIALVTIILGLVLRRLVFDRGIALPFVIVTTVVLGALLLGWRAAATHLRRLR